MINNSMRTRSLSISLLRILATIMIVICHIVKYFEILPFRSIINQMFASGLYIFFLISGYLYGSKKITSYKKLLIGRWKKICLPALIVVLLDLFFCRLMGESISVSSVFAYLLNMQGLLFLCWNFFTQYFSEITNLGPLWFISVIMICYCLIPLFQYIQKKISDSKIKQILVIVFFLIFTFILETYCGIVLIYLVVFYIGYTFRNIYGEESAFNTKSYVLITFIAFCSQLLRLILKGLIGGSSLYSTSVNMIQFILGLWIVVSVYQFKKLYPKHASQLVNHPVSSFIEENSYFIYLTHGLFCMGQSLNVFYWFENEWIAFLLFVILTVLSSKLISWISNRLSFI